MKIGCETAPETKLQIFSCHGWKKYRLFDTNPYLYNVYTYFRSTLKRVFFWLRCGTKKDIPFVPMTVKLLLTTYLYKEHGPICRMKFFLLYSLVVIDVHCQSILSAIFLEIILNKGSHIMCISRWNRHQLAYYSELNKCYWYNTLHYVSRFLRNEMLSILAQHTCNEKKIKQK